MAVDEIVEGTVVVMVSPVHTGSSAESCIRACDRGGDKGGRETGNWKEPSTTAERGLHVSGDNSYNGQRLCGNVFLAVVIIGGGQKCNDFGSKGSRPTHIDYLQHRTACDFATVRGLHEIVRQTSPFSWAVLPSASYLSQT